MKRKPITNWSIAATKALLENTSFSWIRGQEPANIPTVALEVY